MRDSSLLIKFIKMLVESSQQGIQYTSKSKNPELFKKLDDTIWGGMHPYYNDEPFYAPEAPEDAPLGHYAFGEKRYMKFDEKIPAEVNTKIEDSLMIAISDHICDSKKPISAEHARMIKNFIDNGLYKNLFKPVAAGTSIFRGQAVSTSRLKKILGIGDNDMIPGIKGSAKVDYTWKNFRDGEGGGSWTTYKGTAKSFAQLQAPSYGPGLSQRPWCVIFTAEPGQENNFLDLSGKGYGDKTSGLYRFSECEHSTEKEVISLGPVRVSGINWYADLSEQSVMTAINKISSQIKGYKDEK